MAARSSPESMHLPVRSTSNLGWRIRQIDDWPPRALKSRTRGGTEMRHKGSRTIILAVVAATCAGARANAAPDAGAAPPSRAWKQLRSASASASSFLQNNWNRFEENYHPSYVLDENPATAW